MTILDQDLVMFDSTVVTTTDSDIIDLNATGLNNGIGNSPADWWNVEVITDLTGVLTVDLDHATTAGGSYSTVLTHTFADAAKAGAGKSILLTKELNQFIKSTNATATAGTVTTWIGQRKF